MPEQIGTPTMHFPDVPGTRLKSLHHQSWAKWTKLTLFKIPCYPNGENATFKMMFFRIPCTINREKISPNFGDVNF